MYTHLRLPVEYELDNKSVVSGLEALIFALVRLSYPNRLTQHIDVFGRSSSMLSRIFNTVVSDIYERSQRVMCLLNKTHTNLEELAGLVEAKCPLSSCVAFVDGTVRGVCRPKQWQETVYNGHKRKHAIKYQSVMTPDGLITLHGPYPGRRHDAFLFQESGVTEQLSTLPLRPDGTKYVIYGDPAYAITDQVICPYPTVNITAEQQLFNDSMKDVRESVEYGFGKVTQYFAYIDFCKGQRLLLQPVGKHYFVASLFTNCHTCLYGSAVNAIFRSRAPDLADYLFDMDM